ncbi:hypothetical protein FRX31_029310 [Thalictrum thalictroides]|uniref:B3 domain-containing protein n=1 Tax=Thalictrum thalictroides TaxID=46969 RepID=A0A7J6VA53_THATH|nr:hypothetical protein FRX31_029310 [Thalictrum thalictroides]
MSNFDVLISAIGEDVLEAQWEERERERKSIGRSSVAPPKNIVLVQGNKKRKIIDDGHGDEEIEKIVIGEFKSSCPPTIPSDLYSRICVHLDVPWEKVEWLLDKKLEESDVTEQQGRLFISKNDTFEKVLTKEELEKVVVVSAKKNKEKLMNASCKKEAKVKNSRGGLSVMVVDHKGRMWNGFSFRYWPSVGIYVLTTKWTNIISEFRLRKDDVIQIWLCRLPKDKDPEEKLCFGINLISKGRDNGGGDIARTSGGTGGESSRSHRKRKSGRNQAAT